MWDKYFKARSPWDFKPNKFDLGQRYFFSKRHLDVFLLHKITEINNIEFDSLYLHHLSHFNKSNGANEKDFFENVFEIVESGYKKERRKAGEKLNMKAKEKRDKKMLSFKAFLNFLKSYDKWGIIKPDNERIKELESELEELKKELKKYRINNLMYVRDGHLHTLIDIFQQLRTLELEQGVPLIKSDEQSGFYKIITNYFNDGGKEIKMDSVRKYFPKTVDTSSEREVPDKNKIFIIENLNSWDKKHN